MTAAKAETFAPLLEGQPGNRGQRVLYFAAFADIGAPETAPEWLHYRPEVTRAGFYSDTTLRDLVREVEISDGWKLDATTVAETVDPATATVTDELPLLLRVKADPALARDREFLTAALAVRREQELRHRRALAENRASTLWIPEILPEHILSDNRLAKGDDKDKFGAILASLAEFTAIRELDDRRSFYINASTSGVTPEAIYRRYTQEADVVEAAEREVPGALHHRQVPMSNDDKLPLVLAVMNEGFDAPIALNGFAAAAGDGNLPLEARLRYRLRAYRSVAKEYGGDVMVASVDLVGVEVAGPDGLVASASYRAFEPAPPSPAQLDVLGATLGMTLDAAAEAVLAELPQDTSAAPLAGDGPDLEDGRYITVPGDDGANEHIGLFTGAVADRVVAILRYKRLSQPVDPRMLAEALASKYGSPDNQVRGGGEGVHVWFADTMVARRFRDDWPGRGCAMPPYGAVMIAERQMLVKQRETGAAVNLEELSEDCGVVLTIAVASDAFAVLLLDTARALEAKAQRIAAIEAAAAAEAAAKAKAASGSDLGIKF